jgi:hypothetical protein
MLKYHDAFKGDPLLRVVNVSNAISNWEQRGKYERGIPIGRCAHYAIITRRVQQRGACA